MYIKNAVTYRRDIFCKRVCNHVKHKLNDCALRLFDVHYFGIPLYNTEEKQGKINSILIQAEVDYTTTKRRVKHYKVSDN